MLRLYPHRLLHFRLTLLGLHIHRRLPRLGLNRYSVFSTINVAKSPEVLGQAMEDPTTTPQGNEDIDVHLEFEEEPLGLTSEHSFGFPQVDFGDSIGPDGRYEIKRKLGWGRNASVWLARDKQYNRLSQDGLVLELETLKRISSPSTGGSAHCLSLLDHFHHPARDEAATHLCLVTDVLSGTIASLQRTAPDRRYPLPLAKIILRHLLMGLAHAHKHGVVHTDLKPDNVMIGTGSMSTDQIDAHLAAKPPRRHPPERSWPPDRMVEVAVSQPLPLPSIEEALSPSFLIGDFGSAQFYKEPVVDHITSEAFRAPETILQGFWDERVDIWAFGCLISDPNSFQVFELITGSELFRTRFKSIRQEEDHIYQMMMYTHDTFRSDQLKESDPEVALSFFNPHDTFLSKMLPIKEVRQPLEDVIAHYNCTTEGERQGAAEFIRRCLRLNPRHRPSAEELLNDPWLH